MTADYLNAHGATDQIVYAYSTGTEPQDQASYLERYPGHDLIDVLGFASTLTNGKIRISS